MTFQRLLLLFAAVPAIACGDRLVTVCGGFALVRPTVPDSAAIRVDESFVATAGADFDTCPGQPSNRAPERFNWSATDTTIVQIVPTDSIHARITGRRIGTTVITPTYQTTGESVSRIRVVVQP